MAERLGLPEARRAVQAEGLEEGEQVLGGENQLQPDLVGGELAEGEAAQAGVLAAADAVLDASATAMAGFELGQVGVVLVGDEDLEAEALVIGEGELSAGMGAFAPADGAGPLGPGAEVEVGQLADGGALTLLAGLGDGRHPGALGHGQDGVANRLAEVEADREADLEPAQLGDVVLGGAIGS